MDEWETEFEQHFPAAQAGDSTSCCGPELIDTNESVGGH